MSSQGVATIPQLLLPEEESCEKIFGGEADVVEVVKIVVMMITQTIMMMKIEDIILIILNNVCRYFFLWYFCNSFLMKLNEKDENTDYCMDKYSL